MRVLPLACLLCMIVWRVEGYCDTSHTNGCSNYGMLRRYEGIFTPSCDSHDVCYDCGAKFRYTRRGCDQTFHKNVLKVCGSNFAFNPREKRKCEKHANLYKAGVRVFGWLSFKNARKTKSFCGTESWVSGCLRSP